MKNEIFVTGAAGWLGVNLVRILVEGKGDLPASSIPKVSAIKAFVQADDEAPLLKKLGSSVEIFRGDVRSDDNCDQFLKNGSGGTLIHCAGMIHPSRVKEFYSINVEGTKNLLNAAIKNGLKRIVIVSSNSPIGVTKDNDVIFDEKSPYHPYMNYGKSKMQMEQMALSEAKEKIEICLIRTPWFYGPYQPERQTTFFKMIRDGKFPLVGNGQNLRSMAYTDNLSQGLLLAGFNATLPSKIYWIADEKPYAMVEIVNTVRDLLKNKFSLNVIDRQIRIPSFVGDIATLIDASIQSLGLYHQKFHVLSEMNKTIACSVEKAKSELGYQPMVSLKGGMTTSIQWCLDNGLIA
jgi:nucleoside-diphosphate-sugar epimerase